MARSRESASHQIRLPPLSPLPHSPFRSDLPSAPCLRTFASLFPHLSTPSPKLPLFLTLAALAHRWPAAAACVLPHARFLSATRTPHPQLCTHPSHLLARRSCCTVIRCTAQTAGRPHPALSPLCLMSLTWSIPTLCFRLHQPAARCALPWAAAKKV